MVSRGSAYPKALRVLFRPTYAACLYLAQVASGGSTLLTDGFLLVLVGVLITAGGVLLWLIASLDLRKATATRSIATQRVYRHIRHPIYVSVHLITVGLGFVFFSWVWFVVVVAFVPFWYLESREEEHDMTAAHGGEYLEYKAKTRMFIPGAI